MKVAMIYSVPINSIDGASKVVSSFLNNEELYQQNGVYIDVYSPESGPSNNESQRQSLASCLKKIVFKLDFAGVIRTAFGFMFRSERIVKSFVSSGDTEYDVVFFHEFDTCYQYLKRKRNKRTVLVLHTTGDFYSMLFSYYPLMRYTLYYNLFLKHVCKVILKNVDCIVFNSKMAADNFYRFYPKARPDLATFVNNGVKDIIDTNTVLNHPITPPYTIVCVGSVTERKGQRFIVEALNKCDKAVRDKVKFLIVGDGSLKEELQKKCNQYNLCKNVEFCGLQTDVVPFLSKANIFILPSVDEGMPISILEAMRQGLPVVSTRVGGIPYQVVDKRNGLLIDASVEGVLFFLNHIDDYDWVSWGKESRKRYLEIFSMKQMVDNYSRVLKDVGKDESN